MSSTITVQNGASATTSIMHDVIVKGDLQNLSDDQRAVYYAEVCTSIGVNPLTKPFDYIKLNNKLTLYATKTCTDQLRTVRGVSIFKVEAETTSDGLRIVTAYARDSSGREDMDLGVVMVKGLTGEALANGYMKALTKAKRRVTLSICGLGWLDESELDAVPHARPVKVDTSTGEILDSAPVESRASAEQVEFVSPTNRLARLHAIGSDRGLDHDALHRIAMAKFGRGLSQVSDTMVADLCKGIEDASDEELREWSFNWLWALDNAVEFGAEALEEVANQIKEAGITQKSRPDIAEAFQAAKRRLEAQPMEAEYRDVIDRNTGEIVGQEAVSKKAPPVFGQTPETPAPIDKYTT